METRKKRLVPLRNRGDWLLSIIILNSVQRVIRDHYIPFSGVYISRPSLKSLLAHFYHLSAIGIIRHDVTTGPGVV